MLVMNYKVYSGEIQEIDLLQHKMVINTISPHSYTVAKTDNVFRESLHQSDILLPDGYGFVWAVDVLCNKKIKRIAGWDMHNYLLRQLQKEGGKVFYMGSRQNTLNEIEKRLKKEYPSVKMESYSPPYNPEFSPEENEEIVNRINQFAPDVLFVGMTAPKQEKWLHQNKHLLNVMTMCCIGAVFDFYAGTITRSGPFWIHHGLEWLPRFAREPRRLWKRVFISIPVFMTDVYLYKFGLKRTFEDLKIKRTKIMPLVPPFAPESKKKIKIPNLHDVNV
jgi:N-acetylglucosaminyldiphosphoundecaprenol N-acetyl-beta-D-mannosaminyltransferase